MFNWLNHWNETLRGKRSNANEISSAEKPKKMRELPVLVRCEKDISQRHICRSRIKRICHLRILASEEKGRQHMSNAYRFKHL